MQPFEPVDLEAPDGRPYTACSEEELINLTIGAGYRRVGGTPPVRTDPDPVPAQAPAPAAEAKPRRNTTASE